jgi:hypothetical protein
MKTVTAAMETRSEEIPSSKAAHEFSNNYIPKLDWVSR